MQITITGPRGCGKTTVAVEVADFPSDGEISARKKRGLESPVGAKFRHGNRYFLTAVFSMPKGTSRADKHSFFPSK